METKTVNKYKLSFEDIKRNFPDIKGDLVEMSIDEKGSKIVIDTIIAYYEDEKVIIHKEVVLNPKDKFVIKDKATGVTAEGSTEVEAKNRLDEIIKDYAEEKRG